MLKTVEMFKVAQRKQLLNPDSAIQMYASSSHSLLSNYGVCYQGLSTGDSARYLLCNWEVTCRKAWNWIHQSPSEKTYYSGWTHVIPASIIGNPPLGAAIRGREAWNKHGIVFGQMGSIPASLANGEYFPDSTPMLVMKNSKDISALWCYYESGQYVVDLRKANSKLSLNNGYFTKVPFDLDHWTKVAAEKYPNGLPKPYSDDPTQWIFYGHPQPSTDPLQVAVARLLGYTWPAETDEKMELSDEAREWIVRSQTLSAHADDDGIVCIPPVGQESAASDRLLNLLAAAYGDAWSNDTLAQLLNNADHAGKSLETWLREKFFAQHCKRFGNRPFIWQVWDGLSDGFSALVNYHKLDYKTLESLIYTYLGDWISRQKRDAENRVDGAQEKLAAAEVLKKRLELILEGEAPYDIFVRWKPLEEQPIGWNPDLNDGVRMNIRPFLSVPDVGKRGAGVLRDKPNIKWEKDRGADVPSAPWYNLGPEYGGNKGDRINDHHLSLEEKRLARDKTS